MFLLVKLLQGYQKPLFYKIPKTWDTKNLVGSIVTVPLKNNIVPALVLKIVPSAPKTSSSSKRSFQIKEAIERDHLPQDDLYPNFIKKISQFYLAPTKLFYQRVRQFIYTDNKNSTSQSTKPAPPKKPKISIPVIILTDEQQHVVDYLNPVIKKPHYAPILLHGVTGSGKTEIYKKGIVENFTQNKTTLFLLPEVSLCIQFEHILSKKLPANIPVFSFHSATKSKDKKILWSYLREKKPCLIIGVHIPALLPIPNLGLIIVDEEHEPGFQEKKHPKINSKEIALWRAKLYDIPILLGSATPSLTSLHMSKKPPWKSFLLKKRFAGTFPEIKTVLINKKTGPKRKNFWITRELEKEISLRLEKKVSPSTKASPSAQEQIIIYLNRRGYSFFVQCKECGFTFLCPDCSVSLTLHKSKKSFLRCHYCDYKTEDPQKCPKCNNEKLLKRGIGTQQIVNILEELFPTANIARADLDTTKKKREWGETIKNFEDGKIDILVGTQTITKGYHFPNVTLIGIIWADLNVHFPVFNANETALQQLIQVAGRAGRQNNESKSLVIAQIMHDHPIFDFLNEEKYLDFCKTELAFREETSYPPFGRFFQIELKNTNAEQIEKDSSEIFDFLSEQIENALVLGPTKPLVYRVQKTEIRHIFIKSKDFSQIYKALQKIDFLKFDSQIFVIPT